VLLAVLHSHHGIRLQCWKDKRGENNT